MKKIITMLIIIILSTTVCFADIPLSTTQPIDKVSNDLYLVQKAIITNPNDYNYSSVIKNLKSDYTLLNTLEKQLETEKPLKSTSLETAIYDETILVITYYKTVIDNILYYLEDINNNQNYYLKAVYTYDNAYTSFQNLKAIK